MFKVMICCFLLTTPVLYEGRFRPVECVPTDGSYTPLNCENYKDLAGKVYLEAGQKCLKYPTQGQLHAELILFKVPFKWLIISGYLAALMLLLWRPRWGWACVLGAFTLHTLNLGLRCYVLERAPVSNMAETLLYVPWITVLTGILFYRAKTAIAAATATAAALLIFLPARPGLENVQAVLNSHYWLIIHVLMVVGSYGVLFLSGFCGHFYLLKRNPSQKLEKTIIQTLYLGSALLICGTILGGVWAAESWGRFWDWDPKEAWAFISSGIYLIVIHAYRFKKIGSRGLATGSIIGLIAITFTWYGVNFILGSGLHSYGFGNGGEWLYYLYLGIEILFLVWAFLKINLAKNWMIEKKGRSR